jgi:hypothetical protein
MLIEAASTVPRPNEAAFVVSGGDGVVLAELAEGALGGIALLAGEGIEPGSRPRSLPRRSRLRVWAACSATAGAPRTCLDAPAGAAP